MQISGLVSIEIDVVDIEQTAIENKLAQGKQNIFVIILAALNHPEMALFKRAVETNNHCLEYQSFVDFPEQKKTRVIFSVREKTSAELAA